MQLHITGLYAGVLAILYVALSYLVTTHRKRLKVGLENGDDEMQKAIRVHGNFAEYVPFALFLMALTEINGAPSWSIYLLGGVLTAARLMHARGLMGSAGYSVNRYWGTALTFAVVFASGLVNIVLFVQQLLTTTPSG